MRIVKRQKTYKPKNAVQKKAIKFMTSQKCGGLFLKPGQGKTGVTLESIEHWKAQAGGRIKVLLVTYLRVAYLQWPGEINKFAFNLKYTVLHGKNLYKGLDDDVDIYITNIDSLRKVLDATDREFFDALVIDESTLFKSSNAATRFKAIKSRLPYFDRRWILTGLPNPQSMIDLWTQIYIIDLGGALGKYKQQYLRCYFEPTEMTIQRGGRPQKFVSEWNLAKGADKKIAKLLKPLVFQSSAKEDLPDIHHLEVRVQLPAKIRKIYDNLEKDYIHFLKNQDTPIVAAGAASMGMKLRQITGGFVYNDQISDSGKTFRDVAELHKEKIDACKERIEVIDSPTIISYEFQFELVLLMRAFPKAEYIGGGAPDFGFPACSPTKSTQIANRWNRGGLKILIAQSASISHGLNLQSSGHNLIFYSLTYNYETYYQLLKRIWRPGQKSSDVYMWYILVENSIDFDIYETLKSKGSNAKKFMADLAKAALSRRRAS